MSLLANMPKCIFSAGLSCYECFIRVVCYGTRGGVDCPINVFNASAISEISAWLIAAYTTVRVIFYRFQVAVSV